MDTGQIVFMYGRLILGAFAAFLAITLWSKTRDAAWMLIILGIISTYIEMIYSIPELLGLGLRHNLFIGSVPLAAIALSTLHTIFFIAAFLVMVIRQYRHQ